MNDLTVYNEARHELLPGDVIMFWGTGFVSGAIEAFDDGPSHCAVVRQAMAGGEDVTITESTILNGVNGVQTNPLGERIAYYDAGGAVAALLLGTEVKFNTFNFYKFIGEIDQHVTYDKLDLLEFILRGVPILGNRIGQTEHTSQMVCSSCVAAILEAAGVLGHENYTEMTPQSLVEKKIYGRMVPLYGNPKLVRFNSL
jgi:hypothetical protein